MDKKENIKRIYYLLRCDSYGQPSGNIEKIQLTESEYEKRKAKGEYIFDEYIEAHYRSLD